MTIDTTANIDSYVGNGEAAVNFAANPEPASRRPYIAARPPITRVLPPDQRAGQHREYRAQLRLSRGPSEHRCGVGWGLEDDALETVRESGALSLKVTDDAAYGFHYEADPTLDYTPGLAEIQVLTSRKTTTEYYLPHPAAHLPVSQVLRWRGGL